MRWPVVALIAAVVVGGAALELNRFHAAVVRPEPAGPALPPAAAAGLVAPTLPAQQGVWISQEEIKKLPTAGPAWEALKAAADRPPGPATLADIGSMHDTNALAMGLVYARTGAPAYRQRALAAISGVIGTEKNGQAVMVDRNIVCYVITADLIDLAHYLPKFDAMFRVYLSRLRAQRFPDGSMIENDNLRVNNHGRTAGAARAAIDAYLGDHADLQRSARVFKGFLGDTKAYQGFDWRTGGEWQGAPKQPVGINAAGVIVNGHDVGGAFPEQMRRDSCGFRWPPCATRRPWEGMGGAIVEANILHRQGYDVWNWQDKALLRSATFLQRLDREFGGWWATADDTWQPWLLNRAYGTSFRTEPAAAGKNMGFTDWMYPASR